MPLLTSWKYYFVDVKDGHSVKRHVIEEERWIKFKEAISTWKKFINLWTSSKVLFIDHFNIDAFGELPIDDDALLQLKKLEQPIQEYIKKRILYGYKIQTLDDLRFNVALYYENQTTTW